MADPCNPADIPEPWSRDYPGHPKSEGYTKAVSRRVKNNRHLLVVDMAEQVGKVLAKLGTREVELAGKSDAWWRDLAIIAGHPSSIPSPTTRAAVIAKVRADLERG